MDLLFLVSGNKNQVLESQKLSLSSLLSNNIEVVKIDEKELIHLMKMVKKIKSANYSNVYFAVYDIKYLRFEYFMKLTLIVSYQKGYIIDQFSRNITINRFKFCFYDTPLFLLETFVSSLILLYYKLKL